MTGAALGGLVVPMLSNMALGGIGYARSAELTPEEEAALKQKYNLAPDANLRARNTGRAVVGGTLGGVAGLGAGAYAGYKLHERMLDNYLRGNGKYNSKLRFVAPAVLAAGSLLGSKLMTDKYSKANAQKAMYEQSLGQ